MEKLLFIAFLICMLIYYVSKFKMVAEKATGENFFSKKHLHYVANIFMLAVVAGIALTIATYVFGEEIGFRVGGVCIWGGILYFAVKHKDFQKQTRAMKSLIIFLSVACIFGVVVMPLPEGLTSGQPISKEARFVRIAEEAITLGLGKTQEHKIESNNTQSREIGKAAMSTEEFLDLCAKGTPNEVEAAIEGGADVNAEQEYGHWPLKVLTIAAMNPNPEVIALLLKSNADINVKDVYNEALSYAASYEDTEVIALLLKRGADINAKGDENGWTPLICAARYGNTKAIAFLLKSGADVNAKSNDGNTALMIALGDSHNPEDISLLLKNGADVNTEGSYGETVLIAAASYSTSEIVELLLKNGVDVQARDSDGKRAIDYAEGNDNLKGTAAFKQLQEVSGIKDH